MSAFDDVLGLLFDLPGQAGDPHMERALEDIKAFSRRIAEGSSLDDPSARWPEASGRVLVELAGRAMGTAVERTLEQQGYQVAVCGGPTSLHRGACPLVTAGTCPLVDGADVVVYALDVDDADDRAVLEAHRLHPERPACVVVPPRLVERYRALLEGYEVVESPLTPGKLTDALGRITARGRPRRRGSAAAGDRPVQRAAAHPPPPWTSVFRLPETERRGRIAGGWD
jgi:hypothetical protein